MAKEYEEYRPVLAELYEHFQKNWVTAKEIASYDKCDPRTAAKRYGIPKHSGGIDITILAIRKCQLAHGK